MSKDLTPEKVQEAWVMASHMFMWECYEEGIKYRDYPYELMYGFTLETLIQRQDGILDDLILNILSWDVGTLTDKFLRAHRVGHRNFLWLPLMGHIHKSALPNIHKVASEYFDSL